MESSKQAEVYNNAASIFRFDDFVFHWVIKKYSQNYYNNTTTFPGRMLNDKTRRKKMAHEIHII